MGFSRFTYQRVKVAGKSRVNLSEALPLADHCPNKAKVSERAIFIQTKRVAVKQYGEFLRGMTSCDMWLQKMRKHLLQILLATFAFKAMSNFSL